MAEAASLDVSTAEKKVWLVKFPPLVAQRLHALGAQAGAAGAAVGVVRCIENAAQSSSDFRLKLEPQIFPNVPEEFEMRPRTDSDQVAYSFVQEGAAAVSAESDLDLTTGVAGRVDQRFDVQMKQNSQRLADPQYRSLTRERQHKAAAKTRTMQVIDDPRNLLMRPLPSNYTKRKADKPTDNKRLRMEKDALENLLFGLFEKQSTWSFVQLQRETDQPVPWLKEVLNGIALLNKTGPNKDKWEIKKEYRK